LLVRILKARRLKKFNNQLVEALSAMSNSLKAGFSITQSFESIARDGQSPIAQEFGAFLQQTRVGVSFSDALENLQERVGSDDLNLVCMAVETARQTGGNLTGIFEQIAMTIRERFRIENRINTLTAQGKLQGIVVGAMPLIIGAALMIVDPGMMIPFLRSMMGLSIIVIVAVLLTFGGLIIRKIVRIDV
jgi:tight adherence protein B